MEKKLSRFLPVIALSCLIMVILCSCTQNKDAFKKDPFFKLYDSFDKKTLKSDNRITSASSDQKLVTLSCNDMSLAVFCRILSDRYGFGVVFSEKLYDKKFTGEFKNTPVDVVFNVISRQLSVDVVFIGNTFFIGDLKSEDKAIYNARVYGYEAVELQKVIQAILSQTGKVEVLSNGVITAADHDNVIRRVVQTVDYLRTVSVDTYIVQLYFVRLRKDLLLKAGLNVTTSGSISYDISNNKLEFENFRINGLFNATGEGALSDTYLQPMFLVRDGKKAKWSRGESYPIPKYTTQENGSVVVSGYDYIDTGFQVVAFCAESQLGALLNLDLSISSVTSFVKDSPVINKTSISLSADMELQKLYLLSDLTETTQVHELSNILMFGRDTGSFSVQLWGQVYKIKGGVKKTPPEPSQTDLLDKIFTQ